MEAILKTKKHMRIYCILLFILAAMDTASMILLLTSGELSMASITSNHSAAMAVGITCIMLALLAFNILSKLYVGIKGITQSKGQQGKSVHIKVAKIAIVVLAISFVYSVCRSFSGSVNWPAMLNPPISIMILVSFIKDARQLALSGWHGSDGYENSNEDY